MIHLILNLKFTVCFPLVIASIFLFCTSLGWVLEVFIKIVDMASWLHSLFNPLNFLVEIGSYSWYFCEIFKDS